MTREDLIEANWKTRQSDRSKVQSMKESHRDGALFAFSQSDELVRELVKAMKGLEARIVDGTLVRDISKDNLPNWSFKAATLAINLSEFKEALAKAKLEGFE